MLKIKNVIDRNLYYWVYALYLFDFVFIERSTASLWGGVIIGFHALIRPIMVASMLYLTALNLYACPSKKLFVQKFGILVIIASLVLIGYHHSELQYFAILCLLAIPAETKSFDKIVNTTFRVLAFSVCLIIFLAIIGVLPNHVFYTLRGARFSFGFFNPNTLSMWVVILSCLWTIKKYQTFSHLDALGIVLLTCSIVCFTKTRTAVLCIATLLLLVAFFKLAERHAFIASCTKYIAACFLPSCLGISLFISFRYQETSFFLWLDNLVSSRFSLGHTALTTYPLSLFGRIPDWEIVLDNVYVRTLLYDGILLFILFWGLYYFLIQKWFKEGKMALVIVCCVYALLGISENTVCHYGFNCTLLALGQLLPQSPINITSDTPYTFSAFL